MQLGKEKMNIKKEINSTLSEREFLIWKYRLKNILELNQHRYNIDTQAEIERRKHLSSVFGSLCLESKDLPGEIWANYKIERYEVSSFGRVKYDGEIVPQIDEKDKIGYLMLIAKKTGTKYVYQMIAETFLIKPTTETYHVHHITNNGYDNSVGNLIYLTQKQHSEIHQKMNIETRY